MAAVLGFFEPKQAPTLKVELRRSLHKDRPRLRGAELAALHRGPQPHSFVIEHNPLVVGELLAARRIAKPATQSHPPLVWRARVIARGLHGSVLPLLQLIEGRPLL